MIALAGWLTAGVVTVLLSRQLRVRRELVARACHEVRGPLMAAGLALHQARRAGGDGAAAVTAAEAQLERAARLLADLGLAGRGTAPLDRVDELDLGALVADEARTWAPAAAGAGRHLRLVPPPAGARVRADPDRVRQVTGNLVANALEHGRGTVSLRLEATDGVVRLGVGDDGPGAVRGGRRARRRRRRRAGRGRGLAISADLARRHGGRLVAEPGAAVVLELPRVPR